MNSAANTSHSFIPRAAGERTRKEEAKRLSVQSPGKGAIHIQRGIIWGHFLNKVLMELPITLCISRPDHFHLCLKKGSASSGVVIRTKGVKLNLRRAMAAVKLMTDCSSARGVTKIYLLLFFFFQHRESLSRKVTDFTMRASSMRWQLRGCTLPFHGGEVRLQSTEVAGYEQFDMGGGCLSEGRVTETGRETEEK